MATVLALSREVREWPESDSACVQETPERSVYQPSGGTRPVAALLSVAAVGGLLTAFAAIQVHHDVAHPKRLVVLSLRSLQPPPPPKPKQQPQRARVTPSPAFAPPRAVLPPVTAPTIVTPDIKAPPPPLLPLVVAPPSQAAAPQATAAGPVDKGDLSSKMIEAPPPSYPMESRRLHEQGTVKLVVTLNTDGRVADVEIAATSGFYRLDRAALGAVRRWRWAPSLQDATPVMVQGYVTIPFILKA
ncbi:energy transducer TonB [Sphingomonas oryzagri]